MVNQVQGCGSQQGTNMAKVHDTRAMPWHLHVACMHTACGYATQRKVHLVIWQQYDRHGKIFLAYSGNIPVIKIYDRNIPVMKNPGNQLFFHFFIFHYSVPLSPTARLWCGVQARVDHHYAHHTGPHRAQACGRYLQWEIFVPGFDSRSYPKSVTRRTCS